MDHKDVLYEISIIGKEPEKEWARKELKKARHADRTLTKIYMAAVRQSSDVTYTDSVLSFMKEFLKNQEQQASLVKSDIINIRLSPSERANIEKCAAEQGVSVSQYIRSVLFKGKGKEK